MGDWRGANGGGNWKCVSVHVFMVKDERHPQKKKMEIYSVFEILRVREQISQLADYVPEVDDDDETSDEESDSKLVLLLYNGSACVRSSYWYLFTEYFFIKIWLIFCLLKFGKRKKFVISSSPEFLWLRWNVQVICWTFERKCLCVLVLMASKQRRYFWSAYFLVVKHLIHWNW